LKDKGINYDTPDQTSRVKPIKNDRRCNRINIMFSLLKDWRGVANRYDRCAKCLLYARALTANAVVWL
jgi:hypothetical protein